MSNEISLVDLCDSYRVLTLNRPEKLNAFNIPLLKALRAALDELVAEESCRTVLITGSGRGFCAGQDLSNRDPAMIDDNPDLGISGKTTAEVYRQKAKILMRCLSALFYVVITGAVFAQDGNPSSADGRWYSCIVKAGSHTGRYTFKIATEPCQVYWREIDTSLKIRDCKPPVIAALKPSARDDLSIVWFHLETGAFYDYLSGVKDRGICTALSKEP